MRVRVYCDPETAALIDQETVPVLFTPSDHGLPDHVPALQPIVRAVEEIPMLRLQFSLYGLITADGKRLLGFSSIPYADIIKFGEPYGPPYLARMKQHILDARLRRSLEMESKVSAEAAQKLAEFDPRSETAREAELIVLTDSRIITWAWTSGLHGTGKWENFAASLLPERADDLAPGVRNASIALLGNFITDYRPVPIRWKRLMCEHYRARFGNDKTCDWSGSAFPQENLQEAARALIAANDLNVDLNGDWLAQVQLWWLVHEKSPEFRVEYSPERRGTAFFR